MLGTLRMVAGRCTHSSTGFNPPKKSKANDSQREVTVAVCG